MQSSLPSSIAFACALLAVTPSPVAAQTGGDAPEPDVLDVTGGRPTLVDARYASLGGYLEANVGYTGEDGVDEGLSFAFPRLTLFVFSQISRHIRMLAELEFEDGTEEIKLETAQVDFEVSPEFVVRAGVILAPIGRFNQDHDAPKWDFVDRPLVSTTIIPATLSEVGVGTLGRVGLGAARLNYQLYLTQGLSDGVVDNVVGRTDIPSGRSPALFEEDNNGSPAVTGRVGFELDGVEVGVSNWSGVYNTFRVEGERVDRARWLSISAIDVQIEFGRLTFRGEAAYAAIDVPTTLVGPFGERQVGFHADLGARLLDFRALGVANQLLAGVRFDAVDHNYGMLSSMARPAGDQTTRVTGALALRPGNEAVVRLNYFYQWAYDLVGNAPSRSAGLQLGVATYF